MAAGRKQQHGTSSGTGRFTTRAKAINPTGSSVTACEPGRAPAMCRFRWRERAGGGGGGGGRGWRLGRRPWLRSRGAGVEDLAVEVDVELDRGETAGRRVHAGAEGGEPPFVRAGLPRVTHEVVGAVLGLADPLARRLA